MNMATSSRRPSAVWLLAIALATPACGKGEDGTSAQSAQAGAAEPAGGAATLAPPPPPVEPPPPPTEDAGAWTPAALDEMLAPIALYPDPILAQVLAASTNAQEVLDAGNWLIANPDLEGDALSQPATDAGFSPSVQALVHFPTVVDMMCRELDWTKQLGDAFSADQGAVLASVQRLRKQAADAGNLQSTKEMKVETTEQEGHQVIVVQPADPKIIYVPQYNPVQVYTPPPTTTTTTTTTTSPATTSSGISTGEAVIGGLLAFTAGVLVADAFDDDDDYYGYPNWGHGGVYYGPRPYYPHNTFVYAPNYSGYRPAGAYRPPANYANQYNNNRNYQNNSINNVNVNVNSNNSYFNRFDKNQNRVSSYQAKSPVARSTTAARPTTAQGNTWKGSSTYAGASQRGATGATTSGRANAARPGGQARPTSQYAGTRPSTGQSSRPSSGQSSRPTQARPQYSGDRGYPQTSGRRPDATTAQQRGGEFQGAGRQQASRDRAASQRGKASMASAPRPSASRGGRKGRS